MQAVKLTKMQELPSALIIFPLPGKSHFKEVDVFLKSGINAEAFL